MQSSGSSDKQRCPYSINMVIAQALMLERIKENRCIHGTADLYV